MNKKTKILLLFILLMGGGKLIFPREQMDFTWSMFIKDKQNHLSVYYPGKSLPPGPGDRFQISLESEHNYYVYLYYFSQAGKFYFLYPGKGNFKPLIGETILPRDGAHYTCEKEGGGKLFFIVSSAPLKMLEKDTRRWMDKGDKYLEQLLNRIHQITKNIKLPTDIITPEPIAGVFRGPDDEEEFFLEMHVLCSGMYSLIIPLQGINE